VWQAGQPEPTAWLSSVTDTTAALQAPGSIAVQASLSSSATSSVLARIDNFDARPPH